LSIRVAVVGCGKIAEKHLNAYRKLEGVQATVTDIVERGKAVAESYGAQWHPFPEELIQSDSVDAVDVCTPTPTHADFILEALASNKHVFCEKPLARDVAEALSIREAAARSGTIVMVGYLYRFHPAFEFARSVLRDGVIGKPYFATFRLGGRGSHKAWKHKRDTGGGAANEMLVHMIDLALWYFGEAERITNVYTATILADREIEGEMISSDAEDIAVFQMRTASGVTALIQSDLITPGYMNHIEVQGTNGSLFSSILDYMPTSVYCKESRGIYDRGHNFQEFPKVDLFERELRHFLDRVRGGNGDRINSLEDSIRLMRVLEAVLPRRTAERSQETVARVLSVDGDAPLNPRDLASIVRRPT
jgi:myo-inositol 2-dehydrogenase / D-chiro-inositol 1-dehydrogenase